MLIAVDQLIKAEIRSDLLSAWASTTNLRKFLLDLQSSHLYAKWTDVYKAAEWCF